jgi:hypothetical protein
MLCESIVAVTITLVSVHTNKTYPDYPYNDTNPGLLVECDTGITAGVWYNSFSKTSGFLGYQYNYILPLPMKEEIPISIGAAGGICSGYKYPFCGGLLLGVSNLQVQIVPKVFGFTNATAINFGVKFKF